MSPRLEDAIKKAALEAGFDLAGIAAVREFPELARFPEWIASGRAGEMKYLESRDEAGKLRRASLRSVFPWARSVVVCAVNYNTHSHIRQQSRIPVEGGSRAMPG